MRLDKLESLQKLTIISPLSILSQKSKGVNGIETLLLNAYLIERAKVIIETIDNEDEQKAQLYPLFKTISYLMESIDPNTPLEEVMTQKEFEQIKRDFKIRFAR